MNIVKQDLLHKKQFLKILWSEVWKGGIQLMLILVLLGMYFDTVVVFVTSQRLLFRLALAILWHSFILRSKILGLNLREVDNFTKVQDTTFWFPNQIEIFHVLNCNFRLSILSIMNISMFLYSVLFLTGCVALFSTLLQ